MKILKVGLLVANTISDKYTRELALWGKMQARVEISHLIIYGSGKQIESGNVMELLQPSGSFLSVSKILFRIILFFEELLLQFSPTHKNHNQRFQLDEISNALIPIAPMTSQLSGDYYFSAGDIAKVKALNLDILVQCGPGHLSGEIVNASRLGLTAIHYGDDRVLDDGSPPGFWESYYKWPQTGFTIQRQVQERGMGEVLVRGCFRTCFYYSLNQAHVRTKSLTHLKGFLNKVALAGALPVMVGAPTQNSYSKLHFPHMVHAIVYGCKLLKRTVAKAIFNLLRVKKRFGISVVSSKWNEALLSRSVEASLPKGRSWADPFLHTRNGKTFCFVEDFVYASNRGHITALEITGTQIVESGIALQEPFHLSFPYLFEYQGELYMCPESSETQQIRIYRCTEFPLKWELEKVIFDGVSAVDTMLFEKGGSWWMFTNIDESGSGDYESELYLFSADSPLSTIWIPHEQNPIRIDSLGGRNGGLIIDGERHFRLGQCQGFDQYGKSLRIHEIKEISNSLYVEEMVAAIEPTFRSGLLGTHHLSTNGRTTVIDHVSFSIVL